MDVRYLYNYQATVDRVIDGDTVEVTVDLGFRVALRQTVRLYGINAPELHGPTAAAGQAARDFLRKLLPAGTQILITSFKANGAGDKYGRWLGKLEFADGMSVNEEMVRTGNAVRYMDGQ